MKKIKDPIQQRWKKLRSAIRNVWQYDFSRKEVITAAQYINQTGQKVFDCPICKATKEIDMVTVDHEPELGGFSTWAEFFSWIQRCFEGPRRAVCKPCHRRKPVKRGNKRLSIVQDNAPKS